MMVSDMTEKEAIKEDEAKELLLEYAIDKYEELFGKIPEA